MGLLLSILVVCVGVVELLNVYSNFRTNAQFAPCDNDISTLIRNYDRLYEISLLNERKRILKIIEENQKRDDLPKNIYKSDSIINNSDEIRSSVVFHDLENDFTNTFGAETATNNNLTLVDDYSSDETTVDEEPSCEIETENGRFKHKRFKRPNSATRVKFGLKSQVDFKRSKSPSRSNVPLKALKIADLSGQFNSDSYCKRSPSPLKGLLQPKFEMTGSQLTELPKNEQSRLVDVTHPDELGCNERSICSNYLNDSEKDICNLAQIKQTQESLDILNFSKNRETLDNCGYEPTKLSRREGLDEKSEIVPRSLDQTNALETLDISKIELLEIENTNTTRGVEDQALSGREILKNSRLSSLEEVGICSTKTIEENLHFPFSLEVQNTFRTADFDPGKGTNETFQENCVVEEKNIQSVNENTATNEELCSLPPVSFTTDEILEESPSVETKYNTQLTPFIEDEEKVLNYPLSSQETINKPNDSKILVSGYEASLNQKSASVEEVQCADFPKLITKNENRKVDEFYSSEQTCSIENSVSIRLEEPNNSNKTSQPQSFDFKDVKMSPTSSSKATIFEEAFDGRSKYEVRKLSSLSQKALEDVGKIQDYNQNQSDDAEVLSKIRRNEEAQSNAQESVDNLMQYEVQLESNHESKSQVGSDSDLVPTECSERLTKAQKITEDVQVVEDQFLETNSAFQNEDNTTETKNVIQSSGVETIKAKENKMIPFVSQERTEVIEDENVAITLKCDETGELREARYTSKVQEVLTGDKALSEENTFHVIEEFLIPILNGEENVAQDQISEAVVPKQMEVISKEGDEHDEKLLKLMCRSTEESLLATIADLVQEDESRILESFIKLKETAENECVLDHLKQNIEIIPNQVQAKSTNERFNEELCEKALNLENLTFLTHVQDEESIETDKSRAQKIENFDIETSGAEQFGEGICVTTVMECEDKYGNRGEAEATKSLATNSPTSNFSEKAPLAVKSDILSVVFAVGEEPIKASETSADSAQNNKVLDIESAADKAIEQFGRELCLTSVVKCEDKHHDEDGITKNVEINAQTLFSSEKAASTTCGELISATIAENEKPILDERSKISAQNMEALDIESAVDKTVEQFAGELCVTSVVKCKDNHHDEDETTKNVEIDAQTLCSFEKASSTTCGELISATLAEGEKSIFNETISAQNIEDLDIESPADKLIEKFGEDLYATTVIKREDKRHEDETTKNEEINAQTLCSSEKAPLTTCGELISSTIDEGEKRTLDERSEISAQSIEVLDIESAADKSIDQFGGELCVRSVVTCEDKHHDEDQTTKNAQNLRSSEKAASTTCVELIIPATIPEGEKLILDETNEISAQKTKEIILTSEFREEICDKVVKCDNSNSYLEEEAVGAQISNISQQSPPVENPPNPQRKQSLCVEHKNINYEKDAVDTETSSAPTAFWVN